MRLGYRLPTIACALMLQLGAQNVRAQSTAFTTPENEGALDARIAALGAYLEGVRRPTQAYYVTWISVFSALAAGQVVYASVTEDRATRVGAIIGASLSASGALATALYPHPGRRAILRFRLMPQATADQKRAKVMAGEKWLADEARSERLVTSWVPHVFAVALALGLGLGLGLGFDDNAANAVRTAVGTFVVTELRVWTRSRRAMRYVRRYRAAPTAGADLSFAPLIRQQTSGLALQVAF